jgi:16S rRNA (cytosine967-C5)-methyltransferase
VREGFDRILVDAPCSGIGSARRRPELLWRARKDELAGLARLQVGIATAAAGLLRPGGLLVYSVCTFPRAETDAACDALVRRAPQLEPVEIAGPDGPAERIRLWPHRHGCDAMFVAAFRGRATPRG